MFHESFRTAAAIRTASMTCLQALLQGKLFISEQLGQSIEDLIPKVYTTCMHICMHIQRRLTNDLHLYVDSTGDVLSG